MKSEYARMTEGLGAARLDGLRWTRPRRRLRLPKAAPHIAFGLALAGLAAFLLAGCYAG